MEALKTYKQKNGNKILKIYQDEFNDFSPRDNDNVGEMICFYKGWELGDENDLNQDDFNSWEELKEYLIKEKKAVIILPLSVYEHGSLTIKIGNYKGLLPEGHYEFDTSNVGFVYVTKEKLKEEGLTKKKAEKIINAEVEEYNKYLNGEVYGFKITKTKKCKCCNHIEEIDIDSCWGFIGYENIDEELFSYANLDRDKFKEIDN